MQCWVRVNAGELVILLLLLLITIHRRFRVTELSVVQIRWELLSSVASDEGSKQMPVKRWDCLFCFVHAWGMQTSWTCLAVQAWVIMSTRISSYPQHTKTWLNDNIPLRLQIFSEMNCPFWWVYFLQPRFELRCYFYPFIFAIPPRFVAPCLVSRRFVTQLQSISARLG